MNIKNEIEPEILVLVLQLKNLKTKLANQIDMIQNNTEMYDFLTKKQRKFISDDMKNRFSDEVNNDFSIVLSDKEKELLKIIDDTFENSKNDNDLTDRILKEIDEALK